MQIIVIFFLISSTFWLAFENSSPLEHFYRLLQAHCSGPKRKTNNETLDLLLFSGCYFECFFFGTRKCASCLFSIAVLIIFLKDFLSVFYRAQHLISLFFFFHLKFCRRDVDWPLNFCDEKYGIQRGTRCRAVRIGAKPKTEIRETNISESFISCAHTFTEGPHYVSASSRQHRSGFLVIFSKCFIPYVVGGGFWFQIFIGACVRVKLCVSPMRIWISRRKWRRWP